MPAKCHRRFEPKAYTRKATKVVKKAYVRGIPGAKIRMFDMGNKSKREWNWQVDLISKQHIQLRHNQLEAVRVTINAFLVKKLTKIAFYFKIRSYPHNIMRENPMATGAGADRFQRGMRKSFGKPVGFAARVRKNTKVMSVWVDELEHLPPVKEILRRSCGKLSGNFRLEISEFKGKRI
ncbi:MAG: 50S ribosomal protein L16 [Candidatus Altiarchaeota archaeon]|nr:50S ribosomal protein L16 [Candidatus Altiarchaeota archaeon]